MSIHHKNFAETTLAAAITTTSETSITVTSSASFPAVDFIIAIDTEAMLVTNVSGTTWTVTRGYESSTAATHLNGAAIYHDISAAEADAIAGKKTDNVSATDKVLGRASAGSGAIEEIACTAAGRALLDDANAAAQLATLGALPLAGGTLTGNLIMDNMDVTLVKLLTLHGEIDDGNSSTADTIDWNTGTAHKSTLTGNVTLAFTGSFDVVPAMTANDTPSGYTVSASSFLGSGYEPWRAFSDVVGSDTSIWMAGAVPSVGTPQWLQMLFATAHTITKYSLRTRDYPAGQPTDWTLLGSNNGTDWTTLDTRTGVSWNTNERKEFPIASPASFTYYRFRCTADSNSALSIDEMELLEGVIDPTAPCFLTLKLIQDATGGRVVTWPATVKGAPVINQAANSVSNVLFYWDGTSYWTLNGLPWVAAPAAANSAGFAGQMAWDTSYFYICTAANTWKRVAIATW